MLASLPPARQAVIATRNAERSARSATRFAQHRDALMDLLRCRNCGHVFVPCQLRAGNDLGHAADGSRATQLYAPCRCSYTEHGADQHQLSDVGPKGWPFVEHTRPLTEAAEETLTTWIATAPTGELDSLLVAHVIYPRPWPHCGYLQWHQALAPLKPHDEAYRVLFSVRGHRMAAGRLYNLIVEHRVCEGRRGRQRCGRVLDAELLRQSEALDGRRYCRFCRPVDPELAGQHPHLFAPWAVDHRETVDPVAAAAQRARLDLALRAQCLQSIRETGEPFPGASVDTYRDLQEAARA